jgi:hypothetical protein
MIFRGKGNQIPRFCHSQFPRACRYSESSARSRQLSGMALIPKFHDASTVRVITFPRTNATARLPSPARRPENVFSSVQTPRFAQVIQNSKFRSLYYMLLVRSLNLLNCRLVRGQVFDVERDVGHNAA